MKPTGNIWKKCVDTYENNNYLCQLKNKSAIGGIHQKSSIIVSVVDAVRDVPGEHYDVYPCALRKRRNDCALSPL